MRMRGQVIARQILPPIPDRRFDWCAYHDGHPEEHCGWGPTAEEAVADLYRLDQERAEAEAEAMDSDYDD